MKRSLLITFTLSVMLVFTSSCSEDDSNDPVTPSSFPIVEYRAYFDSGSGWWEPYGYSFDTVQSGQPINTLTKEFLYNEPAPFGGEYEHYKFKFSPINFLYKQYDFSLPNPLVLSTYTGGDSIQTANMIVYHFATYADVWTQWPNSWCDSTGTECYELQ